MARAVAVTPAQVKAAQMRVARMKERGETPPEKLLKIAKAKVRADDDDAVEAAIENFVEHMMVKRTSNLPADPALFSWGELVKGHEPYTAPTYAPYAAAKLAGLFPTSQFIRIVDRPSLGEAAILVDGARVSVYDKDHLKAALLKQFGIAPAKSE